MPTIHDSSVVHDKSPGGIHHGKLVDVHLVLDLHVHVSIEGLETRDGVPQDCENKSV